MDDCVWALGLHIPHAVDSVDQLLPFGFVRVRLHQGVKQKAK